MKKKTSLFLLSLTLVLSMFLSGCGQSQTNVPSSENDSTADTSAVDTNTPAGEPEAPEDSQAVITDTPAETGAPIEEPESGADTKGEEAANVPADNTPAPEAPAPVTAPEPAAPESAPEPTPEETPVSNTTLSGTELTLRFGGGEEFTIHMYDNDTANQIAEYVGTASWQLPIYHFDDYDGWEFFQYYDIPRRYDIPDGSQSVTSEKAGAVYYSHPNRIIPFYQDADISSEYTPVGCVDFSQDLVDAVEDNPVVEGWGNKLVFIQP